MTQPTSLDLSLQAVGKRYPSAQAEGGVLQVLTGVDLDIPAGQFVSIVGASGCGKSTLLRLILGLDDSYEGAITLGGEPVRGTGPERGIVFQDHRLFPWLTVAQNIAVGLRNAAISNNEKRDRVAEHIALVGLEGFEQSYPHQISGGMAQRVAIARGLVNRPRVLLLDEPFGALDALTRARLQTELQRIWHQHRIPLLLVTHDLAAPAPPGDRVVISQPPPARPPPPPNAPLAQPPHPPRPTHPPTPPERPPASTQPHTASQPPGRPPA
ncbi:ABC transporter ATP-binding protein, partial [Achromobacter ruhlandii]